MELELEVEKVLHMNGGEGEFSYASNSSLQKTAILKVKPSIRESIAYIYGNHDLVGECLKFADLGCSSGPNAFMPTLEVIKALHSTCHGLNHKPPMLQVYLNDLPGNDFNCTFKLLPSFYERLKKPDGDESGQCFVAAVPGSFYGRLFPPHSLHFIFSSYSLHWLSQVPRELVNQSGDQLNKGNVYIASTSPPSVHRAYLNQFESDFTLFLRLRAEEIKPGGRMVLTLIARHKNHDGIWEVLGMVINDMVSEGLIEESKLDSFNMPAYAPYPEEVRSVIQREGSFNIHQLETFKLNQADCLIDQKKNKENLDSHQRGKISANHIRSVGQSLLADHFGHSMVDDMFERFSIKVTQYLDIAFGESTNLLITLVKKID